MIAPGEAAVARASVVLNLELCHGRHGAWARVELHERPEAAPGARRIARVALRGWIDRPATQRLEETLADLAARGVDQVLLDCGELLHLDYRETPALVESLRRFDASRAGVVICGLSRHLQDLFWFSGLESTVRCWPSAAELLEAPASYEAPRETAT